MLQSNDYNVVVCRDRDCKLCSTSNMDPKQSQAYVVYTCESTKCKLCREETDVLLDLFCPFNTVEDIAEMTTKLNNIIAAPCSLVHDDGFTTMTEFQWEASLIQTEGDIDMLNFQEPSSRDGSQTLLAVSQSPAAGQETDRQRTNFEIIQNLQPVDERLLTDLEKELQVDQLEDLPELMDICDFIPR